MRLAELSWSADDLTRLAAELRHAGYPEPARTIDFVSERMASDEFNAELATTLRQEHSQNRNRMCDSGVWPYLAGVAREFIDEEKFDSLGDIPSDRFFWAEGVGPLTVYRFVGAGRAIQASNFSNSQALGWLSAHLVVVAERGPFRLVPTAMVVAAERRQ
ncbi:hypothetical protein [Nocardia colli]|uniref:hypothetical protein n=1 Tax=Nocardia colli TaxID=2545717 RepID=UPI0035E38EEF